MDIAFNELSVVNEAVEQEVIKWFDLFLINSKELQKITKKTASIVSSVSIKDLRFCNYTAMQWLSRQSKNDKQLFLKLSTNKPLIHDYPYYYFGQNPCKGFAYGYENKALCTSLPSRPEWNSSSITIEKEFLDNDLNYKKEGGLTVDHFSDLQHLSQLAAGILSKIKGELDSELSKLDGVSLWNQREAIFPSLIFCEDVRVQIIQYSSKDDSFQQIIKKLSELEQYFSQWDGNFEFSKLPFKNSPESISRTNFLTEKLTILCPDNQYRFFEWHFRFTPEHGRGYFHPDSNLRKCFIGFIGKKIIKK